MSSSPAQTEAATDCRTCKTRRIKCDRGLPGCLKCSKKQLSCPGYEKPLRWANAVAVRGRSKGLKRPASPEVTRTTRRTKPRAPSPTPEVSGVGDEAAPRPWAINVNTNGLANFPDSATIELLLEHYDKKIARVLVWMDSEQNGYRRLLLPLARQQPVVLLSILAVSGSHLARTSGVVSSFPKSACDTAMGMITSEIQQITNGLAQGNDISDEIDTTTAQWLLASMLTLSTFGMVEPGSTDWFSHRQAARTLIKVLSTIEQPPSELYQFLKNMLAVDDVLASTTSFDLESMDSIILPEAAQDNILFGRYLRLLHQVTTTTRPSYQNNLTGVRDRVEPMAARDIRSGFEMARASTLIAFGRLHDAIGAERRDFIRLTDAYHHAGLLYAYRCFRHSTDVEVGDIQYSTKLLFEALAALENVPEWAHYLPWPAFILGSESRNNFEYMAFLRETYSSLIGYMGFSQFGTSLRFLEELWAGQDEDWLQRAKEWSDRGVTLLLY